MTQSGYADYIPVFLSETQKLYRSGTLPCDVAMIQVSPRTRTATYRWALRSTPRWPPSSAPVR